MSSFEGRGSMLNLLFKEYSQSTYKTVSMAKMVLTRDNKTVMLHVDRNVMLKGL